MLTKQAYLKLRDKDEIPFDIWFEFYQERGGVLDRASFEEIFTVLMTEEAVVSTSSGDKIITFPGALKRFFQYYNNKFKLSP